MAEPMDPRGVLVAVGEDLARDVLEMRVPAVTTGYLVELCMIAFVRGAASMRHAPDWAAQILDAVNADQHAVFQGSTITDAALVAAQVAQWPIATAPQ